MKKINFENIFIGILIAIILGGWFGLFDADAKVSYPAGSLLQPNDVTSVHIRDGTIANVDVSSTAAIAYSKLNLAGKIVNADVSGTAAIADTKLAAITTAGKVDGSALTNLANIPAGAGQIPAANIAAFGMQLLFNATTSIAQETITGTIAIARRHYLLIAQTGTPSANTQTKLIINGDAQTNYSYRRLINGGVWSSNTNQTDFVCGTNTKSSSSLEARISNIQNGAKTINCTHLSGSSAAVAVSSTQVIGIWTSSTASIVNISVAAETGLTFASGSELWIYGSND